MVIDKTSLHEILINGEKKKENHLPDNLSGKADCLPKLPFFFSFNVTTENLL